MTVGLDPITRTIVGGTGDVVGPASAVADRIAVFDGTTGKLIKDGGSTIADIVAGSGGLVTSVFGRTGAIVAVTNDYTWAQVNKATSSLADITTRSAGDLSSGTLLAARMPALTGDVTTSAGAVATTIANDAVTLAKMANMATASFLGRNTAATGDPEVLSIATAKTMLGLTGTNSGDVALNGENYLSIVGQTITAGSINLASTHVTSTLTVNKGGTGTATTFTQGSVVFAGASGIYTQDNASFFWDDTNNQLGVGTATPGVALGGTTYAGRLLHLVNSGGIAQIAVSGTTASGYNLETTNATATKRVFGLAYFGSSNVVKAYFFNEATGATTVDNVLVLKNDGNVGIGVASPSQRLELNGSVFINASTANLYLKDISTGWQSASTTVITPQASNSIRSTSFTSGLIGWSINAGGDAEFANVTVRGTIRSAVFVYNALQATSGTLGVFKSAAKLKSDVVVTASPTYGTTTFTIDAVDQDGVTHATSQLFVVNDILRLKDGLVGDTWFKVTAVSDQTTFWRYTASIQAGTNNVTYRAGMAIADYGLSGAGFIIQTADQANSPYMQMATHAATFSSADSAGTLNVTPRLRVGNLNGSYGYAADTYGFGTGQYGVAGQSWLTVDPTNGVRIGNNVTVYTQLDNSGNASFIGSITASSGSIAGWSITATSLSSGSGATTVALDTTSTGADDIRIYAGSATASSAPFRVTESGALTASNATITGAITASSGSITGVLNMSGSGGALAFGTTPPTSSTSGTGAWFDRTGLYFLLSSTLVSKFDTNGVTLNESPVIFKSGSSTIGTLQNSATGVALSATSSSGAGSMAFTSQNSSSDRQTSLNLQSPASAKSYVEIYGQTNFQGVTIGNQAAPAASAILDLVSTTSGLLPPRMTTTQRDAISSPSNGLILYNSTADKLQVRAAAAWVDLH